MALPVELRFGDARAEHVIEPVFDSNMFIFQAGLKHAQTVIFVHGQGDAGLLDWKNLIPLAASRYHVIAFDLPGFGRSAKGDGLYSPRNYARLIEWIRQRYGREQLILVGHSMGGAISLFYAGSYSNRLSKLILFDVAAVLHRVAYQKHLVGGVGASADNLNLLGMQRRKLTRWMGSVMEDTEEWGRTAGGLLSEERFRHVVLRGNPSAIAGFALAEADFSAIVGRVTVPVHMMWGENDSIAPLRTGKVLQAVLANASLTTIEQAAHVPMNERPDITKKLFDDALRAELRPERFDLPKFVAGQKSLRIPCETGGRGVVSGAFDHLAVVDCVDVELKNVMAKKIIILRSVVEIEDSVVVSDEAGLVVEDSTVVATRLSVEGKVGIDISGSRIDLAAVRIHGKIDPIRATGDNVVVCSFCRVEQLDLAVTKHGLYRVNKNNADSFVLSDGSNSPLNLFGENVRSVDSSKPQDQ